MRGRIPLAVDRDEAQVTSLLAELDRDPSTPSFSFMFFECTHAAYSFRPQDVVRPDYLDELNYVFTDVPEEIGRIKNRYVNAAHCLDRQLGRIFDHLKAKGLLERTIVVVTGDHREEFREHGRWGHNSAFSKEQISPPLVLRLPGAAPAERRDLTSHLDIAPTVLRALGVTNPASDLSLGHDLLGPERRRYNVVCDWYTVVWSDERTRAAFRLGDVRGAEVTVDDPGPFLAEHQADLLEVMAGLRAFRQPGAR
jgi:uncharacterized protein